MKSLPVHWSCKTSKIGHIDLPLDLPLDRLVEGFPHLINYLIRPEYEGLDHLDKVRMVSGIKHLDRMRLEDSLAITMIILMECWLLKTRSTDLPRVSSFSG
jgi:hypothetical protein